MTTMMRTLFAATVLSLTTAATAAPVPGVLHGGPENFTAAIRMNHTAAGDFVDEFFFPFAGLASVNAQLSAIFQPAQQASNQIVFTDVELNDFDFVISARPGQNTVRNSARLTPIETAGGFLLRVEGCAGACDGVQQAGTAITASYSGTVNVNRIPEPASLALALFALGLGALATPRRAAR